LLLWSDFTPGRRTCLTFILILEVLK
jgi:hypothetical protein